MEPTPQEVVNMLRKCWESYRKDAFGADVYHPISHSGQWFGSNKRGIGFTIVDSLDTLLLAGLRTEYEQGREWVARSLSFNVDANVNDYRVLGGLLSGYTLTGDRILLDRARELGDRLLPAYDTPNGLPYPQVNLATGKGSYYNSRAELSLAEVGTLQLEMRELSRIPNIGSGQTCDDVVARMKSLDGLLPTVFSSQATSLDTLGYTMGAMADSYYEYLLKRWLQSGKTDSSLRKRYDDAMFGMRSYVFAGDFGNDGKFSPRMQHLTCFIGATLALGSVNDHRDSGRAKNDLTLAADITRTCTAYGNCFTSIEDKRDLMESFLIAETFKYLLLIFDDNPNTLPLDRYVLNTEAHPLPIFKSIKS
ncbi:glycoside hydrolase [Syncephalis plumigaleata]|nr:glycoside hydrolase [Syncephalis plumigaleata]